MSSFRVSVQNKSSLLITKEEAIQLIQGNPSFLLNYSVENPVATKIYAIMVLGCYRPVVLVEYQRIAYVYEAYNTRVCLDSQINSSESCFDLFKEEPLYTPLTKENVVLEVKYNQKLMGFISKILKNYDLTNIALSKYCLGRKIYEDFNY